MKNARKVVAAALAAAALGLAGCGEKPQDAPNSSGKYLGKPDTRPWEGEALAFGTNEFKRGDKASWETAMRTRAQAQNEYARTQ
jgi:hypothetical protein